MGFSPNGYRRGNNREVAEAVGAKLEKQTWPYVAKDDLGLILTGCKEEPRNFFCSFYRMRLCLWISTVLSCKESGANINLITAPTDPVIIGGARTTHDSKSGLEETTSLSREINEAMDLRASLKDMRKKRRTDLRPVNLVISSKEEADSGRLEHHHKRRTNYAGPSAMIAITPTSPLVSSPFMAHESSLITAHGSSLPSTHPYIPSSLPPVEGSLAEEDETTKRHMCIAESSSGAKKTPLSMLTSSLQVLLVDATMVNEVVAKKERKEALDVDMQKMAEEHKATVNQIIEEHKAAMARLEQKQIEALKEFKKETLENLGNLAQELKSNVLFTNLSCG
ncbi:hypothetical protein J1N35_041025 [Gossypium stocksii]|uniref:Uncharacterized protein n=1 Tax=Gossypium stocksii TaxID=47602 RepID=A0A9D3ZIX4_9ROSI|nr:hypothetical protein J1N35_041025 [Gossypium stocksii]